MFFPIAGECREFIVLDLEWNQSSYAPNHRMPHEIIEIGACRVDAQGNVLGSFSRLIRPRVYRRLDKHIRSVTGITEAEVKSGGTFEDVFADFRAFCGEGARLITWGRDDYPVLRRNAAFFGQPLPFAPPVDAQLVFAHACLGDPHQQMNLHSALERMNLSPDVPAHRAVYDAQCTAALLPAIDAAMRAMEPQALSDEALMAVACPLCGGTTRFDTPWFDSDRGKYLALSSCESHGMVLGQMHFKRAQSGLLIMHQRAYAASEEEIADVRERYRLYQLTPPRKRHHRLNMEDAARRVSAQQKTSVPK